MNSGKSMAARGRSWMKPGAAAWLLLLAGASGCSRAPAPPPAPGDYQVLTPSAYSDSCRFCAVPDAVRECDAGNATIRLHWHLQESGARVVNIFVSDPGGGEKPFAQYGPEGTVEVGPWIRPGQSFHLRDDADGRLLAELAVAGVGC
ncbi:hypothetical protein [Pseudoxanthomonas sp. 10H]|uniref:hypothetical protein n=1 Tax=Pseudoxanthomonas sp. 10H TaxID=3242729 RepID=UPI003557C477